MILAMVLQLAAAAPPSRLSPKDSVKLERRVNDAEFSYIMDWRHEWEGWRQDLAEEEQARRKDVGRIPAPVYLKPPTGPCPVMLNGAIEAVRYDLDQHEFMAHFIPGRRGLAREATWECPRWINPAEAALPHELSGILDGGGTPMDEALGIDNALPSDLQDTVRAHRAPLLALLDSAGTLLPGDGWIAGQRVRMHVDQREISSALRVATACRAAAWWCGMLRAYVRFSVHDTPIAEREIDGALALMPPDTLCRWSDLSALLPSTARTAYEKLSCADQAMVNARTWWLADPLYLEPANERRVDHFARRVLGVLHAGVDVDERDDMRNDYNGLAVQEMVLRYGWPNANLWTPPRKCAPGLKPPLKGVPATPGMCYFVTPPGWSKFDTRSTYLGLTGLNNNKMPAQPVYSGPQYHTVPTWDAINDPLHSAAGDWDLGPARVDPPLWDISWWAPEFYTRYEGPLVDLATQIGFVRRHSTAALVAAMEWPVAATALAPPGQAVVGVTTSGGPSEKPRTASVSMDGANPRAMLTPVESRPLLLGVEMVPANDSGPAGRTRFGIAPPAPLSAMRPGTLSLSDIMLARANPGELSPTSIQDLLPRMYGSTRLVRPGRVALFWEVYGQRDGDTVDVSLQIRRTSGTGSLARLGAALGIGDAENDSVTVRWREPRAGDPLAFADSGESIRPRGFTLDLSQLTAGDYTLSVRVARGSESAVSPLRSFTVVRR